MIGTLKIALVKSAVVFSPEARVVPDAVHLPHLLRPSGSFSQKPLPPNFDLTQIKFRVKIYREFLKLSFSIISLKPA